MLTQAFCSAVQNPLMLSLSQTGSALTPVISSAGFAIPARANRRLSSFFPATPDTDAIGRMIMDGASECIVKPFNQELVSLKLRQVGLI